MKELAELLALFVAAVILAGAARRVGAPYPVFLAIGGAAILMKTHAQLVEELPSAAPALAALGLESGRVVDVEVTGLSGRALVVLDKTGPTPAEYPRRAGVPGRRPLTR